MAQKPQIPDHRIQSLADKDVWVLDVDDCMYSMDCSLRDYIQHNIARVFNAVAAHDPQKDLILQKLGATLAAQNISVPDITHIRSEDLGAAFMPIVKTLHDVAPEKIRNYLHHFYGNAYDLITPSHDLVKAFRIAQSKGIEIYAYTNGPSSQQADRDLHLQRVMKRHGFDNAEIDHMRTRTYDLMMSVRAGRGKPEAQGMQDFLNHFSINPSTALMGDDTIKNLKTAAQFGMATLWTWTSAKAADEQAKKIARSIHSIRVRDTGAALLQIAQAYNS